MSERHDCNRCRRGVYGGTINGLCSDCATARMNTLEVRLQAADELSARLRKELDAAKSRHVNIRFGDDAAQAEIARLRDEAERNRRDLLEAGEILLLLSNAFYAHEHPHGHYLPSETGHMWTESACDKAAARAWDRMIALFNSWDNNETGRRLDRMHVLQDAAIDAAREGTNNERMCK